jgi:hypothetical protein
MSTTIEATYDGQVFRPAGPVLLEPNTSVRLTIEALPTGTGEPVAEDYPEADFYEPVEYNWTDSAHEVEQALVSYSGRTDAYR